MNKPTRKFSKASVTGFITAFLSPMFLLLLFVCLCNFKSYDTAYFYPVVNTLVASTLIFNRAGIVFSLIGLISSGRKHTRGNGFAIAGIILAELQAIIYLLGLLLHLVQRFVWAY